jgi:hypothetical protein
MDKRDPNPQLPRRQLYGPTVGERQSTLRQVAAKLPPVTEKTVTELRKSVTAVTNKQSVTPKSVTGKRGVKPKGEVAMSAADRMKAYRARMKRVK